MAEPARRYRAGDDIDDRCRVCKMVRSHTVFVADGDGRPLRVVCNTCRSQHNFRGGDEDEAPRDPARRRVPPGERHPFPLVSDRERRYPEVSSEELRTLGPDLELFLRRILREELGLTPVIPGERWKGGEMVLRPGRPGLQEKTWPIETFFHKLVMVRNKLRLIEQQVAAADEIPDALKTKLLAYLTGCHGSLTSFNLLFADEDDQFRGSGGRE